MLVSLRRLLLPLVVIILLLGSGAAWWTRRGGAAPAPLVYVGLGASDTVGVGADRPALEGWVPRVHEALPAGTQLLNLGVSGATLDEVLQAQLPPALDARPRWVSLWSGVNDIRAGVALATFVAQLDSVLQSFAAQRPDAGSPHPKVLVLNIPDLRYLPAFGSRAPADLDATVRRWNAAIADAARRHGATVVDLYAHGSELEAHPEYISADGFHPSSAGYQRIAEYVVSSLREDVSSSTR